MPAVTRSVTRGRVDKTENGGFKFEVPLYIQSEGVVELTASFEKTLPLLFRVEFANEN
jgi:hypothetical protein